MTKVARFLKRYPVQVDIAILVIGFMVGANLYLLFKLSGLPKETVNSLLPYHGFHWSMPTLAGFIIGICFSILEFRFFDFFHLKSRFLTAIVKFLTYSLVILTTSLLIHVTVGVTIHGDQVIQSVLKSRSFIKTDLFLSLYIYLMILGVTLNFFRSIGNRFGHGILLNYIWGKYREPIEEDRVFMFIDLNNSTGIAEQLGHVKYSRMLNKCFNILSDTLLKYEGEIYQFVGDEAVITWNNKELENKEVPFKLFYAFRQALENQLDDFQHKFGLMPTFKASVHTGNVSVTEVGKRKKEIAYHGDVLNTGARLLELRKKYGQDLLTTKSYLNSASSLKTYSSVYLTTLMLRGKHEEVAVYGIEVLN